MKKFKMGPPGEPKSAAAAELAKRLGLHVETIVIEAGSYPPAFPLPLIKPKPKRRKFNRNRP